MKTSCWFGDSRHRWRVSKIRRQNQEVGECNVAAAIKITQCVRITQRDLTEHYGPNRRIKAPPLGCDDRRSRDTVREHDLERVAFGNVSQRVDVKLGALHVQCRSEDVCIGISQYKRIGRSLGWINVDFPTGFLLRYGSDEISAE